MSITVKIEGVEPGLLMNSLGGYGADLPPEVKKKGIRDIRQWYEHDKEAARSWEAENGAYRMAKGKQQGGKTPFCIPLDVIWGCFLCSMGGYKVKVGGKSKPAKGIFPSIFNVAEQEIVLTDRKGKPLYEFTETVTKMVRVPPRTGGRIPRTWGRLFPWFAEFTFQTINATSEQIEVGKEVLVYGGTFVGIMDGRPGLKRFNYGRFEVTGWEVK